MNTYFDAIRKLYGAEQLTAAERQALLDELFRLRTSDTKSFTLTSPAM